MTINQYISELRVSLPKDYPNIDDRTLLALMNEFRAVYIKNQMNQNDAHLPEEFKQRIKGVALNIVAQKELPFISDNSRILKSDAIIPERINLSNRDLSLKIWDSKVLGQEFSYINRDRAKYAGSGKFNQTEVYCFIYEKYLYVKISRANPNSTLVDFVSIEGVFENPEDVTAMQYKQYKDWLEFEYPITLTAWGYIKSNILQHGLGVIKATEEDE